MVKEAGSSLPVQQGSGWTCSAFHTLCHGNMRGASTSWNPVLRMTYHVCAKALVRHEHKKPTRTT